MHKANILQKYNDKTMAQRGMAMVEVAIAIPFIALLFFGTFEFGMILHKKQDLTTITSEVAKACFRNCAYASAGPCLDELLAEYKPFFNASFENTHQLSISIYQHNQSTVKYDLAEHNGNAANGGEIGMGMGMSLGGVGSEVVEDLAVLAGQVTTAAAFASKFQEDTMANFQNSVSSFSEDHPSVCVVEAWNTYQGVGPVIDKVISNPTLYAVSIN